MPLYEYECQACGRRTELIQKVEAAPLAACPECGGPVRKLLSPPAVQFKGSGWYVTDYGGRGKKEAARGEGEAGAEAGKGEGEGGKGEGGKAGGEGAGGAGDKKAGGDR